MSMRNWIFAGVAIFSIAAPGAALAQRAAGGPPDWPCVQRLVPELSASAIWRGPAIDSLDKKWWSDSEIGPLVRFAVARATSQEDALARVSAFAQQMPEEEKETRLTMLFSGLFEKISTERTRTIDKIRSYSRGQVRQLEAIGTIVDDLEAARSAEDAEKIARLEQEIFWEKRLFDSRQASLRALCEQPYLLEERLSRLVRAMQPAKK